VQLPARGVVRMDSPAGAISAAPAPCPSRGADQPCPRPPPGRRPASSAVARHQQPPPPQQVSCTAAEQQQPSVGDQVARQHPLQALRREAQVTADRRQGDVHDRGIGDVEELHRAQQQQEQPAPAGGKQRTGLGGHEQPPRLDELCTVLRLAASGRYLVQSQLKCARTCPSPASTATRSDRHVLAGLAEHHPALDAGQQPRGQQGRVGVRTQFPRAAASAPARPPAAVSQASNPAAACSRASSLRPATSVARRPDRAPRHARLLEPGHEPGQRVLQPGQRRTRRRGPGSARPPTCAQRNPTAAAASSSRPRK